MLKMLRSAQDDSGRRRFNALMLLTSRRVRVAQDGCGRNGIISMIAKTKETFQFDAIDDVVSDIAKGRIVIVTDDADRENEGDLVMAAEKVTPEAINFMATHGRGCPCDGKWCGRVGSGGHTEGGVDLARKAGVTTGGVLCEILHDDGTMARLPELMEFRKKHGLRICTIQSLIAHRRVREKLVELEQIVKMPTDYGDFDLHLYRSKLDGQHHLALVKGK